MKLLARSCCQCLGTKDTPFRAGMALEGGRLPLKGRFSQVKVADSAYVNIAYPPYSFAMDSGPWANISRACDHG